MSWASGSPRRTRLIHLYPDRYHVIIRSGVAPAVAFAITVSLYVGREDYRSTEMTGFGLSETPHQRARNADIYPAG